MKILVFSDSHGRVSQMIDAILAHDPDLVLHLGDGEHDIATVTDGFPALEIIRVTGNCDREFRPVYQRRLTFGNQVILMGHGHQWQVKSGYGGAIAAARESGATVVLFGHTHQAYCQQEVGLWVMNPGSVAQGNYGMIMLEKDEILCYTVKA